MIAALTVATAPFAPANAAGVGTVLFQNAFNNKTVDGTGTVSLPTPTSGTNVACLTARGNSATLPLLSCPGSIDAQGSGKLRLTDASLNQVGGVFGQNSFPSSNGLDVTFNSYQWGGNSADGIAFMLAAVDPANPVAPTTMGPSGGSLGYSRAGSIKGLTNAYLGVGLDVFGNFSSTSTSGSGCAADPDFSAQRAGAVAVRGPGSGTVGYCGLDTTSDGTLATKLTLRADTRSASAVPVQVLINPTPSSFTSASGVIVAAGTYKVVVKPVGQTSRTLSGPLPAAPAGLYPSSSWTTASGVPKQLAFGFVGSTGSVIDAHEISDVKVLTFDPVPQLSVSSTSYAAAVSQPGDPINYRITPRVLAGADEASAVSVTQTVPTGVVPVGAYGTGWVCQAPVARTITCTTSASSFVNGTTLPVLTVVAIVTGTNVTSSFVQNSSTSNVSSVDAGPGTDTAAAAGTLPTSPAGITTLPASGNISGGGTVLISGTNIAGATAIEIGTAAEQQAGTPKVLLPCPGGFPAAGCFTVSGSTLVVLSWPSRSSAASVGVNVVTLGVDSSATYVYVDRPAAPGTPTATAGITSAVVSWTAPASNGSAITSYTVTPIRNGVAQTPVSFDTSTTTRNLTGLTAAASYTFTVTATNAFGTSVPSAPSVAVTPYTVPGAPTITAVSAGSNGATLSFTPPADGGSAITGYVITPFIGSVAQAAQTFSGTAATRFVSGLTPGTAYTFTVAAQNVAGTGPASARSTAVTPNVSPSLSFTAPPAGEVGVAYSRQLTVNNGTSPFTWTISAGTLPGGLTVGSSNGLLSGTPTAAGSFDFTVRVTDASGGTATKAVTLVIAAAPSLSFSPNPGEVSVPYSQQPVLSGGTGPFVWSVSSGSLPSGVTLNTTSGLVSGTPTASGTFAFTIQVADAFGQTATKTASLTIVALPTFAATSPHIGQVGVSYTHRFDVDGGSLPLTWSISAGSLPAGLSISASTGTMSGTPTTIGSYPFTVTVTDANGKVANASYTAVIGAGPIVITKSSNVSSAAAGATVLYTVTVANTGSSPMTGVAINDPLTGVLDDASYNGNASASAGTVSYSSPNLAWNGNIAAGATVTITYSVTVANPVVGNKILTNTVSSSTLGSNCAASSSDPRCSATVTVPGLTIVKSADTATTNPGRTVRYTIQVTNTGQTGYTGAALTDNLAGNLDDATYNSDAGATSGSVSYASPGLTWTGNLAVGATVTITYSVTVSDPDTGNKVLTGTITSSSAGSPCPSVAPAPQCSTSVTVLVPALVITNTAGVTTTTPGATVPYTVTLSNTGQTAYTGITSTIDLDGATDDATYDGNASASTGAISYAAGTSTLTWSGSIPIGAVVTITGSVTVRDPDSGNKTLTTIASSPAAGSTCPAGSPNAGCTSTVAVLVPQLTITKAADRSSTTPSGIVTYTTSITNTGQTPYTGAAFTESLTGVLDDATYNADASASAGAVSYAGSTVSWSGNLAVGATATVSYTVTVKSPDTGNLSLTSRVVSSTPGNNCLAASIDSRCSTAVAVLIPGLSIVQSADVTTATPGQVLHLTTTVTNTGQTTYTGADVVINFEGATDDISSNSDVQLTTGNLSVGATDATWTLSLAPGASATATVAVTVIDPPPGDKLIQVSATSSAAGSTCPAGNSSSACHNTVTVLVPGLTITKAASSSTVSPGGSIEYTIVVANDGETPYAAANVSDDLTQVLQDAVYDGNATTTSGTLDYTSSVLSWTGSLDEGASATITFSVTVRDPDPGDKRMVNAVRSTTAGSNCAASSTDPRCTAVVNVLVPALTIAATTNAATSAPGATVTHTIKVTNSGATTYSAATLSDTLAGVLDDADYNADAAASSGTVGYSGGVLTWTGALAPDATATITYTVTVHAADGGNNLVTSLVTSSSIGNNCVAGSDDPRCESVVPIARLELKQVAGAPTTTPGSVVHMTQTFTNTGKVPYSGITITSPRADTSDDTIPTGDQVVSSGTLVRTGTAVVWTGSIPVGGVVTSTRTLVVKDPDPGNKLITATLFSDAPGNNCPVGGVDPLCTVSVTVLIPQLTVTKVADTTAVEPGGTVAYTVTVHNSGETAYAAATVVDDLGGVLDKSTLDDNVSATIGGTELDGSTLTWRGALAAGATSTITYSVTIPDSPVGDKTLVNSVTSSDVGSNCMPGRLVPACVSAVTILTPALTIVKTADRANATLGTTINYTIVATNTGQTTYASANLSDSFDELLDDADFGDDADASSGTLSYDDPVLSWSGELVPGASVTITYSAVIHNPDTGDRDMANIVTSGTSGSNCEQGSTDPRCSAAVAITDSVSLTIEKSAGVTTTIADDVVHYTVTVVNSDSTPVSSAAYVDSLVGIVDDADYNDDVSADLGEVVLADSVLTWTGDLAPGATATITYSVTVHTAITGNQILSGTVTSPSLPDSNNCVAGSDDPRCASAVPIARLELKQVAGAPTTTPGSVVHLTETFTNTGKVPYSGITITSPRADTSDDTIPTGDQVASSGTLVRTATSVVWTGNIPVGGVVTSTRTLIVKDPDPGNKLITATLFSDAPGNNCPVGGDDPLCTFSVRVLIPQLTISKTANTTFVVPGGTATYTITVHNTGETAYVGATASDTLVGVLDDATLNGSITSSIGSVSYSSPVLTWTGDLAVGETALISYSVTAHDPATADKAMANPVSSTTPGSTCLPAAASAACQATVAVLTPALTITSSVNHAQSVPGQSVTYTVVATNSGQVSFAAADLDIALGDVLDDATYAGGASATTGTVTVANNLLTWRGELTPTDSVTITYTVTVAATPAGDHRLGQTVTSVTTGSTCASGSPDPRCTTSVPIASLHIKQSSDVAETMPNGVVVLSTTITNTGQVPYTGIEVLEDFAGAVDDFTYNGDGAASSGSLAFDTDLPEATWTGDVAVGATVTITGSGTVNYPDLGDKNVHTLVSTAAVASNCPVGSSDPDCSTNTPVRTPGLTINASADRATATPGATVNYTITITNSGETPYTAATVTDSMTGVLDDADYNVDASVDTGSVDVAGAVLTWTGDLAVRETATIRYSVEVDAVGTGDKVMVDNVASDELGSSCVSGSSDPACRAYVIVLVPSLDVSLSADRTTTTPGGTVGYVLTIHNGGQTDYTGATVTAVLDGVLDDASYSGNAIADAGDVSFDSPDLVWTGDVSIGQTVVVSYAVTADNPPLGDKAMTTTVGSLSPGSTCGEGPQCTNTVMVLIPSLQVSTHADVATATPGDDVEFTITIDNTGQTAYVATTVTASLAGILDDAAFGGTVTASSGVASYTAPTITWTGSLPVGASASVTYRVTVAEPPLGNKTLTTTVLSLATGSSCPVAGVDPGCAASVTILIPQLSIALTAGGPTTTPGSQVDYTLVVTNTGQTSYTGAVVRNSLAGVLPDSSYNGDALASGGDLDYGNAVLTWSGDLAIGASVLITYSVTVDDPDLGDKLLTNTVSSTSPGSTCPPNSESDDCTTLVRVLIPGLVIEKSANRSTVVAGDSVTYTITLRNNGETAYAPAQFSDSLSGVLDDGQYADNATATIGSIELAGDTLVWSGPLEIGEIATITYSVAVDFPATGDRSLANSVLSTSAGSNCASGTDPRCSSTVGVLVPALTIEKSADANEVVAGGQVVYTISATNTGEADYSMAELSDSLANVIDDATYNGDARATTGTASETGGVVSWSGPLPRGATLVLTYSVSVPVAGTGDESLDNTVISSSTGATCPTLTLNPLCSTSTHVAARTITLSGITPSFTLTGPPNSTVSLDEAVGMTVTTNSTTGYQVSVQGTGAFMTALTPGNTSEIALDRLRVRESGTSLFRSISASIALIVHEQSTASSAQGDAVSNDYEVDIPFIDSDTYSTELEYVATTQ